MLADCGRACHRLVVLVQWSVFAVLLTIAWLSYFGVPHRWVEKGLERLRVRGLHLTVERVRLDLLHGVALDDVAVFETPDARQPVLQAEKITLAFDPRAWRRRELGLKSVRVLEGLIHCDLGAPDRGTADPLDLRHVVHSAYARIEPAGVRLVRWQSEGFGARWQGEGFVHWPAPGAPSVAPGGRQPQPAAALAQVRSQRPPWLRRALEEYQTVVSAQPPECKFMFALWPDEPARNSVDLTVEGRETRYRGADFTRWRAEVQSRGPVWSASGWLAQGAKQASVSGTFHSGTGQVQGQFTSSLPVPTLLALAPAAGRAAYNQADLQVRGSLAFELNAGPASLPRVLETLHGRFTAHDVVARGVVLPVLHAVFQREGARLVLTNVKAEVGRGRQRGELTGGCTVDLAAGSYEGTVRTSFAPHALTTLLAESESNLVSQLQLFGLPPATELSFVGRRGTVPFFSLTGRVAVTNFAFRGVPVVSARAKLTMVNGVLDLQDAFVVREEGYGAGRVVINFDDEFIDLDVHGTANPQAAARMIGSNFAQFMQRFEFQGPVHAVVCGRLDIGPTMRATHLRATAEGARLGWRKLIADHGSFNLLLDQACLVITNVAGVMSEGLISGAAVFSDITSATQCAYTVHGEVTNANFALLVQTLGSGRVPTNQAYTGHLSAQARVSGVIGPNLAASTTGAGSLQIKEGQIFRIPLLGGLSQLLGKIYSGLGYLSQSELTSSFTLRDQKIQADDLRVKGSVLSLSSRGAYGFNGDLNFRVQVQLLREGLTADLLRLLTFPVTKLLEFRLLGTLAQPRWRPENLPKELFLKFD